uniref:Rho GTPase-activating protein 23-like n=1 Tax=Petromyzon marinus TaxID=7757 RepID=A0AAJ7TNP0_PETMA|nr:rho GTPase-activating protein 23-like [Petromyzon marinus]
MPGHHYHTLRFLARHLQKVTQHAQHNKMDAHNLAIVFGQTVLRPPCGSLTKLMANMAEHNRLVESLIRHCDWFFSENSDLPTPDDEAKVVGEVKETAGEEEGLASHAEFPDGIPGTEGITDSGSDDTAGGEDTTARRRDAQSAGAAPPRPLSLLSPKRKKKSYSGTRHGNAADEPDTERWAGNEKRSRARAVSAITAAVSSRSAGGGGGPTAPGGGIGGDPAPAPLPAQLTVRVAARGSARVALPLRLFPCGPRGPAPFVAVPLPLLEASVGSADSQTAASAPSTAFRCRIAIVVEPCSDAAAAAAEGGVAQADETGAQQGQQQEQQGTGRSRAFNAFRVKHRDTLTRKRRERHARLQVCASAPPAPSQRGERRGGAPWGVGGEERGDVGGDATRRERPPRWSTACLAPVTDDPRDPPEVSAAQPEPSVVGGSKSSSSSSSRRRREFRLSRSIKTL